MNFIINLSKSKNFVIEEMYDIILMIVDCLIKYAHLILFKETYIAK